MAGFALYLNRRIELEAWDIEISFRNIANRKQSAATRTAGLAVTIFFAGLLTLAAPGTADAATEHDRASVAQLIESVLQGDDFGRERTIRKWRFKDWNEAEEADETFPDWIIDIIEWWEENIEWSDGPTITGFPFNSGRSLCSTDA